MKVKRTDHINLKRLSKELNRRKVRVGFFATARYPDGTPVAYVAAIQELGYPEGNIPSRPFFRNAIKTGEEKWIKNMARLVRSATRGNITGDQALERMGSHIAGEVQQSIADGSYDDLEAATLAARQSRKRTKGVSTKPLIDTAQMLQSVSYQVTEEGEIKPVDKNRKS